MTENDLALFRWSQRRWWMKHAFNVIVGGAVLVLFWTTMPPFVVIPYAAFYGAAITVAAMDWTCRREAQRLGIDLDELDAEGKS